MATASDKRQLIKEAAENDLLAFIRLVAPHRVIPSFHEELIRWWTRSSAKTHQLTLVPRDHSKSTMIAYRCAWEILKNPAIRILYISSTAGLAEKQLKFIKDVLTSDAFRAYWPEYIHAEEGKRERWTQSEIAIDHPMRKQEGIRDSTVFTGGLTTSLTGFHCDIAVLDDVVVQENAYTEEGRSKVKTQYSLLSSIEGAESREWVVGTRYHPKDLYQDLLEMKEGVYDSEGNILQYEEVYEVFERKVEDRGDFTGNFLWPRQQRYDGKWFGFNTAILSQKYAKYLDKTQFRAQYYNDPNDPDGVGIRRDLFQYYEPRHLVLRDGHWFYNGRRLNIVCSVDFAYSLKKTSDYTAIAVCGIDSDRNYYVLDIDRFRTEMISDYFKHIMVLYNKWAFRKLRAETTAAQKAIVTELKENYFKKNGIMLAIEEFSPSTRSGSKNERLRAILEPLYTNNAVYHYRGGACQTLEEELVLKHPPHDDVKDAVAMCFDALIAPNMSGRASSGNIVPINNRFGGVSF